MDFVGIIQKGFCLKFLGLRFYRSSIFLWLMLCEFFSRILIVVWNLQYNTTHYAHIIPFIYTMNPQIKSLVRVVFTNYITIPNQIQFCKNKHSSILDSPNFDNVMPFLWFVSFGWFWAIVWTLNFYSFFWRNQFLSNQIYTFFL